MALTQGDVILRRLRDSKNNLPIKQYCYNLRRFAVGDESALGGNKTAVKYDELNKVRRTNPMFPEFRLGQFENGVPSPVLNWLKVLIDQATIYTPDVIWNDLSPSISSVREAYIRQRLSECNWLPHQRNVVFGLLVEGMSFVKIGFWQNKLGFQYRDLLCLYWDLIAEQPHEFRYIAEELTLPESVAKAEFGASVVQKLAPNRADDQTGESQVKLIEYWDANTKAYINPSMDQVLKREANPFGFIPYEVVSSDQYPSLYAPVPALAKVIGIATEITRVSRALTKTVQSGRPIIEVNLDAYTEESKNAFLDRGMEVTYLVRETSTGDSGINIVKGPDIAPELLAYRKSLEESLVSLIGVNPYAGGMNPKADFASQTQALVNNSSLHVATISQHLTDLLSKTIRKLCKIGSLYDDNPITINIDGLPVEFGPHLPIKPLLKDDVTCSVSPGTPASAPMRLAQNYQLLGVALQTNDRYPNLLHEVLSRILADSGFAGIEKLLQEPQPIDSMGQEPMAEPNLEAA